MRLARDPSFNLETLAAQWRVFGLLAVAFARQILRLEQANPQRALQKAEMLEAWLSGALMMLSQQITSVERRPGNDQEDHQIAARLQAIAAALTALALFVQYLKRGILARVRVEEPDWPDVQPVFNSSLRGLPAYIDTS